MINTTKIDQDGRILQNMTLLNEAEADLNGPWVAGHLDGQEHYVLEGVAVERPNTGLSETHVVSVDTDWAVPNIPEGTEVFIDEESAGVVDEDGLVLMFGLAATYKVRIKPPFPWKPATCEVTVI